MSYTIKIAFVVGGFVLSALAGSAARASVYGDSTSLALWLSSAYTNYHFDFRLTGQGLAVTNNGAAMQVLASSTLKISVEAGNGLIARYPVGFNCEMFAVTAIGKNGTGMAKTVFVKRKNYTYAPNWSAVIGGYVSGDPCKNAQTTASLDFSNMLSGVSQTISIYVSNASYDNCRLFGDTGHGGCPITPVYYTHTIDGSLDALTR